MGYERLEKSLIDLVKEEQAKLGYRKEMIRLYYPLSSLNHFMETNADSEEMQELLADFPKAAEDIFGEVGITHAKDRFCFALSEKASEYVHENMKPNEFIKELVELVAKHGCTMEDIEALFCSHSDKIVTEPMDKGEFDRARTSIIIVLKMKAVILFIIVSCRKIMQILTLNQIRK